MLLFQEQPSKPSQNWYKHATGNMHNMCITMSLTSQGGGLFNIPFVKGFLQNLAILQDHSSQVGLSEAVLKVAVTTLPTLENKKENSCC